MAEKLLVAAAITATTLIGFFLLFSVERTCTEFGNGAFDPPGTPRGESCEWSIRFRY